MAGQDDVLEAARGGGEVAEELERPHQGCVATAWKTVEEEDPLAEALAAHFEAASEA